MELDQAAKKKVLKLDHDGRDYKLGVIEIPAFYLDFKAFRAGDPNYKSTTRDVKRLLNELKDEKVDGVVIDLRNNGGGSLQEATELTGLFIEQGPTVLVRNSDGRVDVLADENSGVYYSGPLAVLVNRLSASASEKRERSASARMICASRSASDTISIASKRSGCNPTPACGKCAARSATSLTPRSCAGWPSTAR